MLADRDVGCVVHGVGALSRWPLSWSCWSCSCVLVVVPRRGRASSVVSRRCSVVVVLVVDVVVEGTVGCRRGWSLWAAPWSCRWRRAGGCGHAGREPPRSSAAGSSAAAVSACVIARRPSVAAARPKRVIPPQPSAAEERRTGERTRARLRAAATRTSVGEGRPLLDNSGPSEHSGNDRRRDRRSRASSSFRSRGVRDTRTCAKSTLDARAVCRQ